MIDAFVRLMNSHDSFTGPVNLGNPAKFSIYELAQKVIALTCSFSKIVYKPLPSDDPKQRQPDITIAKSTLGWEPGMRLEEGLKRTIEYFRKIIKRPD